MSAAILDFAEAYVSKGWRVFPLKPRSKHPATQHGFKDASRDQDQVRAWWGAGADLNIGIATGEASGIFVLDVDPRNSGDETLGALESRFGRLPHTPRAITGGGGQHIFFKCPAGQRLRGSLGDGLDVKNGGGYVVGAPSIHPNGEAYRWDLGALPSETDVADAPPWMLDLLTAEDPGAPPTALPGSSARDTLLGAAFASAGMLGDDLLDGRVRARCPWVSEHTDGRGDGHDSSTVLMPPTTERRWGAFSCRHSHCAGRKYGEVLGVLPLAAVAAAKAKYAAHSQSSPSAPSAGGPDASGQGPEREQRPIAAAPKAETSFAKSIADLFADRSASGPVVHEPTGLLRFDEYTRGGPTYGSTIFVVGSPDASKTLFLWLIAAAYARRGVLCGFLAVDEEPLDLLTRLVQQTRVETPTNDGELVTRHFTRGQFETADAAMLETMKVAVGDLPIVVYDDTWSIDSAADDLAERAKAAGKRAAFFVDSLQTAECAAIRASEREVTERRAVTENTRAVRRAAIRHAMITMGSSESNREWSKGRARGEAPTAMTAGAESRAVEFRARMVVALSPCSEDVIQVDVPKNKLGRRAEPAFWLGINRQTQTLFDVERPVQSGDAAPDAKAQARRQEREARAAERTNRVETERAAKREREAAARLERERQQDAALRAALVEEPGLSEDSLFTALRVRLGSCGDNTSKAIIGRAKLAGWVEVRSGPKNAKLHFLRGT